MHVKNGVTYAENQIMDNIAELQKIFQATYQRQ